jgi:isopenicillin N synthase-like dioxygenase
MSLHALYGTGNFLFFYYFFPFFLLLFLSIVKYHTKLKDHEFLYGEHTDYTGFTLLNANPIDGFEIEQHGEWFGIEEEEEKSASKSLLVNSGDLLKHWTGEIWKSTNHRVRRVSDEDRFSIVFFSGPNDETICESINGKFPPIKAGEHLKQKLAKSNKKE